MSRTVRARLLAAAVAVVATAIGVPAAVQAAPPPPPPVDMTLTVRDGVAAEAGAWFQIRLQSPTDDDWYVENATLTIDSAGITGIATVAPYFVLDNRTPEPECVADGTRLTCDLGRLLDMGDAGNLPYLEVHAKPGIAAGRSGQIRVALTGDGIPPLTATQTVTVADDVDLALSAREGRVEARSGEAVALPLIVTNTGTTPVTGAAVWIRGARALQTGGGYANCWYDRDAEMYCRFDTRLEPGRSYVLLDPPLRARAGITEAGSSSAWHAELSTADELTQSGVTGGLTQGTAGQLRLAPQPEAAAHARGPATDSKRLNNLAFGVVEVLPAVTTPSTGPSASASPSASPSASASASASPSAPVSTSPAPDDGGLPITGPPAGALAGTGAGMVLLGMIALVLTRRRDSPAAG